MSLEEQRDAILRYAERNQFSIDLWLEEIETAGKQGRPIFNQAMKLLRGGKHKGIILHKLDRGARNLKDWVDIGELSDAGVEVHFVSESLDLHSRGGRLSADIQAVVAADFIRNIREETRKGFYGRLKQGLYPLRAPLGYIDNGKGKPKTIDPIMGPLARKAFEMYGTARYNLEILGEELYRLGLRNHSGTRVTRNGLSTLLNNSFYIGIIHIRKSNENFAGIHEPLISKTLFDRVHGILIGKINTRSQRHAFPFRRLLTCATCHYSLIGERQKGNVYYRCHTKGCPPTSIREEIAEAAVVQLLLKIHFDEKEKEYFRAKILNLRESWVKERKDETRNMILKQSQIKDRLNRLTDAYLDHTLDKPMFEERKTSLLLEQKVVEENLATLRKSDAQTPDKLENFLELLGNAWLSHQLAFPEEKRQMVEILTSNRFVNGKKLYLEPSIPFEEIANRFKSDDCSQQQDIPRTWDRLLDILAKLNATGKLPDLPQVFSYQKDILPSQ